MWCAIVTSNTSGTSFSARRFAPRWASSSQCLTFDFESAPFELLVLHDDLKQGVGDVAHVDGFGEGVAGRAGSGVDEGNEGEGGRGDRVPGERSERVLEMWGGVIIITIVLAPPSLSLSLSPVQQLVFRPEHLRGAYDHRVLER